RWPHRPDRRTSWCRGRSAKSSGRYGRGIGIACSTSRSESYSGFILQYLEHTAGHDDAAVAGGHFRGRENETAGGADDAWLRQQDLADLSAVDKMHVELNRRQRRPARHV